jgi:hypothetical protein
MLLAKGRERVEPFRVLSCRVWQQLAAIQIFCILESALAPQIISLENQWLDECWMDASQNKPNHILRYYKFQISCFFTPYE